MNLYILVWLLFAFTMGFLLGVKVHKYFAVKYFSLVYCRVHNWLKKREGEIMPKIDNNVFTKIIDGEMP